MDFHMFTGQKRQFWFIQSGITSILLDLFFGKTINVSLKHFPWEPQKFLSKTSDLIASLFQFPSFDLKVKFVSYGWSLSRMIPAKIRGQELFDNDDDLRRFIRQRIAALNFQPCYRDFCVMLDLGSIVYNRRISRCDILKSSTRITYCSTTVRPFQTTWNNLIRTCDWKD
jgi:hypothetical protein